MRQFFYVILVSVEYSYRSEFKFPDFEVLFSKIQFAIIEMFKMVILDNSVVFFSTFKNGTMWLNLVIPKKLTYTFTIFKFNISDSIIFLV